MKKTIFTAILALTLSGCATAGIVQTGDTGYRWTTTKTILTANIQSVTGTFFSKACPKTMTADRMGWIEQACEKATLSNNPPGDEAYSYVFKIKIKAAVGIPYGEMPAQIYVIGDLDNCLKVSEGHNHRPDGRINEGDLRLSADPAERCVGPLWVR